MRSICYIVVFISPILLFGNDTLKIGLSFIKNLSSVEFKVIHGEYDVFCGKKYLKSIYTNESMKIRSFDDQVILQKEGNKYFFPKDSVKLIAKASQAHFKITSADISHNYNGHLGITSVKGILNFINELLYSSY